MKLIAEIVGGAQDTAILAFADKAVAEKGRLLQSTALQTELKELRQENEQ